MTVVAVAKDGFSVERETHTLLLHASKNLNIGFVFLDGWLRYILGDLRTNVSMHRMSSQDNKGMDGESQENEQCSKNKSNEFICLSMRYKDGWSRMKSARIKD